ncbi:hypothetical protein HK100_012919 [Physocladia obscura]|uniref:Uncharacterized protein n=1 Tax=Physocladia obscura TaxID=109957 RepID=A0AAD5SZ05_9FUNG|nr:hypothetical protein HK100_012919 [Physocladia obscura]
MILYLISESSIKIMWDNIIHERQDDNVLLEIEEGLNLKLNNPSIRLVFLMVGEYNNGRLKKFSFDCVTLIPGSAGVAVQKLLKIQGFRVDPEEPESIVHSLQKLKDISAENRSSLQSLTNGAYAFFEFHGTDHKICLEDKVGRIPEVAGIDNKLQKEQGFLIIHEESKEQLNIDDDNSERRLLPLKEISSGFQIHS